MVQERRALLINRLKEYFRSQGYREVAPARGTDLCFERDGTRAGVKLIEFTGHPVKDRSLARSCVYRFLREEPCDLIYLAVEEVRFSHLPKPEEFDESGVGLLMVNDEGVKVAFPAKLIRNAHAPAQHTATLIDRTSATFSVEETVLKELERRILEQLEKRIIERLNKADATITTLAGSSTASSQSGPAPLLPPEILDVEFVKGNPWLKELSGRGTR